MLSVSPALGRLFVGLAFVVAILVSPALAQRGRRPDDTHADVMARWSRLGERWVSSDVDHDTIPIGAVGGTFVRFARIALRVEPGPLELYDVSIAFGDGRSWSPGTPLVFAEDTARRTVVLPGRAVIRRVDFHYRNLPVDGRAHIELWAR